MTRAAFAAFAAALAIPPGGAAAFDPVARAAALAERPAAVRAALCAPVEPIGAFSAPIVDLPPRGDAPATASAIGFATDVGWLAAQRLGLDDRIAGVRAMRGLGRWAAVGAPWRLSTDAAVPLATRLYPLRTFLSAVLPAWLVLERLSPASAERRATIGVWLTRLARRADVATGPPGSVCAAGGRGSDCNNHGYLRAAVAALDARRLGDDQRLSQALSALERAAAQARPDGGLPLELARGARGDWYQRHAAASLTLLATLADHSDPSWRRTPAAAAYARIVNHVAAARFTARRGRRDLLALFDADVAPALSDRRAGGFDPHAGGAVACLFGDDVRASPNSSAPG